MEPTTKVKNEDEWRSLTIERGHTCDGLASLFGRECGCTTRTEVVRLTPEEVEQMDEYEAALSEAESEEYAEECARLRGEIGETEGVQSSPDLDLLTASKIAYKQLMQQRKKYLDKGRTVPHTIENPAYVLQEAIKKVEGVQSSPDTDEVKE